MYFKGDEYFPEVMSPKVLQDCNNLFYIINALFIAAILGYLVYDNFKDKK